MKIKYKKCGKEFWLEDAIFIVYFNRKEPIYCIDCIWKNQELIPCKKCKHLFEDLGYDSTMRYCKLHPDYFEFYCINKEANDEIVDLGIEVVEGV